MGNFRNFFCKNIIKKWRKYLNISKQLLTADGPFTAIVLAWRHCLANIAPHRFHWRAPDRRALYAHGVLVTHAMRAIGLPGFADLLEWRSIVSAGRDSPCRRQTVAVLTSMGSPLGPVQPWTVQIYVSGNKWQTNSFYIWIFIQHSKTFLQEATQTSLVGLDWTFPLGQ